MNCHICLKEVKKSKYPGYHDACLRNMFGSLKVSPYLDFSIDRMQLDALSKITHRMSISGVQQKLSLRISEDNKIIPTDINGTYILKPSPPDSHYAEVPENEHLSMLICKLLDVESVPIGLFKLPDGKLAYIIKRFDKEGTVRTHSEDMCQIMNINKTPDGQYKYTSSYEEIARKILECTGGNLAIVLEFIKRLIINFLINNGDCHLKNISLQILQPKAEMRFDKLTPNYDCLNTRLYFKDEHVFALDLLADKQFTPDYESLGFYSKADFYELGKRSGINQATIDEICGRIISKKEKILELIDASFLNSGLKAQYKSYVLERFNIFDGNPAPDKLELFF